MNSNGPWAAIAQTPRELLEPQQPRIERQGAKAPVDRLFAIERQGAKAPVGRSFVIERQGARSISAWFLLATAFCAGGCTKKVRSFTSREAVRALTAQQAEIKTERGRAWISVRMPKQKISFPATIAIDRKNPAKPLLRIEAMDPFGATHALMILEDGVHFTWIDFDRREYYEVRGSWYGLPLSHLPELLLGVATMPNDGTVLGADADGFSVRSGDGTLKYLMTWIDPGPRLALSGIERAVGARSTIVVHYSKFMDKPDFYLPRDAKLASFEQNSQTDPILEISIAWRERTWNEPIPAQAFVVPKAALSGFTKM